MIRTLLGSRGGRGGLFVVSPRVSLNISIHVLLSVHVFDTHGEVDRKNHGCFIGFMTCTSWLTSSNPAPNCCTPNQEPCSSRCCRAPRYFKTGMKKLDQAIEHDQPLARWRRLRSTASTGEKQPRGGFSRDAMRPTLLSRGLPRDQYAQERQRLQDAVRALSFVKEVKYTDANFFLMQVGRYSGLSRGLGSTPNCVRVGQPSTRTLSLVGDHAR